MNEANVETAILTQLRFGIDGIKAQMESIEAMARETALKTQQTFAQTTLTTAQTSANAAAKVTALQQAKIEGIVASSEAKKAAIIGKGEAEISAIQAKEALTRQAIAEKEASTQLAVLNQQMAQEKLLYMQARREVFAERPNLIMRHAAWFAAGGLLFGGFDLLKDALVDVEKGMKGLVTVLPELHHDQQAYTEATKETIDLMQKFGAELDEVMSSARSFGRMYKDTETVMGLTHNAILLNVIDMVRLEDAVKGNEAALSIYGKELKNTNEILAFSGKLMDSLTRLSHESMAQASDLIQILQQSAGAAKNAKVELDQLLGLGASAVRATGLQGQGGNLGRMLRTVFVQLSAPTKAVERDIKEIGVAMRNTNGELRNAYDILLDLALATKDASISQEELNQAINRASSGKFQYSKLAALLGSFDEIVQNTARSLNAQGQTMMMAAQQMDTIERKAKMLRSTLIDTFSGAGDRGLRSVIKDMIDVLNQFIMGLNRVSATGINATLALGGLLLTGKLIMSAYTALVPIMGAYAATQGIGTIATESLVGATIAEAEAMMAETVAAETATAATAGFSAAAAIATAGISLLVGGLIYFIYRAGQAEKKQQELVQAAKDQVVVQEQLISQYGDVGSFLDSMANRYQALTNKLATLKEGTVEYNEAMKSRKAIEEAVLLAVDESIKKKIESNGVTYDEILMAKDLTAALRQGAIDRMQIEIDNTQKLIKESNKRIEQMEKEANAAVAASNWVRNYGLTTGPFSGVQDWISEKVVGAYANRKEAKLKAEKDALEKLKRSLSEDQISLAKYMGEADDGLDRAVGGGSDDGKAKDWLQQYLDKVLELANAQNRLNAATQRTIDVEQAQVDLYRQHALTANELLYSYEKEAAMMMLLENKQSGLHNEADAYRAVVAELEATQANLNRSTEDGSEAYKKIGDEIEKAKDKIADLQQEWVKIEGTQRAFADNRFNDFDSWLDKLVNLGAINLETQIQILANVDRSNLSYNVQMNLITKLIDLSKKYLEQQRDAELNAIKLKRDAYKEASDARISSLEKELKLLDDQRRIEEDQLRLAEARQKITDAQTSLTKAQEKLSNVQNERNVRIFQNGVWDYIADPKAIADAEQEIEDARERMRKAQEDLLALQEEYQRNELQRLIEHEREKQQEELKSYDAQIKDREKFWKDKIEQSIVEGLKLNLVEGSLMDNFNTIVQNGLNFAISKWRAYYAEVMAIQQATMMPGGGDGFIGSFASGGPIFADQLAMVHYGEYMLNRDIVNTLGGFRGVEQLISAVKRPGLDSVGADYSRTSNITNASRISIGNLSLPNVYDASGLIRNLEQLS